MIATSNNLKKAYSVADSDGDELPNLEPARLYVFFRCGARTVDAIACSPQDFEDQQRDYGMNCFDCIECTTADNLDQAEGWKPDWERAAQRAYALRGAATRSESSPRPVGGIALIEAFANAIEHCAHPSRARYCYVLLASSPDAFTGDFTV
ncbi:hypothetical protein LZC95_43645 [Pendulispora brunnea]|uniref:Histidine kinase/HSP90-like ATPase domain-containing protein n=1 Tax=Pendulispora brunnea TaxID=2905690 RepID=A0ABZ2KAE2_9BACT